MMIDDGGEAMQVLYSSSGRFNSDSAVVAAIGPHRPLGKAHVSQAGASWDCFPVCGLFDCGVCGA